MMTEAQTDETLKRSCMISVLYSFLLTALMIASVPIRIPLAFYYLIKRLIEEDADVRLR